MNTLLISLITGIVLSASASAATQQLSISCLSASGYYGRFTVTENRNGDLDFVAAQGFDVTGMARALSVPTSPVTAYRLNFTLPASECQRKGLVMQCDSKDVVLSFLGYKVLESLKVEKLALSMTEQSAKTIDAKGVEAQKLAHSVQITAATKDQGASIFHLFGKLPHQKGDAPGKCTLAE